MSIQTTLETALSSYLAPEAAKQVAAVQAKAVSAAFVAFLSNGHTNGNGNGHHTPAKRGRKPAAAVAAPVEAEGVDMGSATSTPSQEVMKLKKLLFWAKKRSTNGGAAKPDDAELIARADEIDNLSTADFVAKGLTAESFLKKAKAKTARAAKASSGKAPAKRVNKRRAAGEVSPELPV